MLINGYSFSAPSLISTNLEATNRAVFVGEETGGAFNGCVAGLYKIYQLPESKLKIRMGLMQIETPFKQAPDGYGVKPNIEIMNKETESEIEDFILEILLTSLFVLIILIIIANIMTKKAIATPLSDFQNGLMGRGNIYFIF